MAEGSEGAASVVRVVDNPDRARFEAYVGDELAGFVTYRLRPGRIVFNHTEVDDAFEGHGVGSRLAREVLDEARARGLAVNPVCPFIRAYIDHHAEYADLVVPGG
jgi:uncharacterized protein